MKPPMTRYNTMTRFLIHLADMVPDSVLGIPHRFPPVKSLENRELNILRETDGHPPFGITERGRGAGLKRSAVRKRRDLVVLFDESSEQQPDDRGASQQRVDAVEDAA